MKYGEYDDRFAAMAKENAVWKSPSHRSTNVASDQWVHERSVCHPVDRGLNLAKEFFTQSSSLLLVPGGSF